jgi:hypothetical protein
MTVRLRRPDIGGLRNSPVQPPQRLPLSAAVSPGPRNDRSDVADRSSAECLTA